MVTVKFNLEDYVILNKTQRGDLVKGAREVAHNEIAAMLGDNFDLNDMDVDITVTVEVVVSNPVEHEIAE